VGFCGFSAPPLGVDLALGVALARLAAEEDVEVSFFGVRLCRRMIDSLCSRLDILRSGGFSTGFTPATASRAEELRLAVDILELPSNLEDIVEVPFTMGARCETST
jgi:hypothetical protein